MKSSQYDHITDELLSAYLDDAVTDQERTLIEAAIEADPEAAWRLETLRHTVLLLQQLPEVAPPQSFVLHEAQIIGVSGDQDLLTTSEPKIRIRPATSRRAQRDVGWWSQLLAGWRSFWQPGNPWLRNAAAVSLVLLLLLMVGSSQIPGSPFSVWSDSLPMAVQDTSSQDAAGEQVAVVPQRRAQEAAPAPAPQATDQALSGDTTATETITSDAEKDVAETSAETAAGASTDATEVATEDSQEDVAQLSAEQNAAAADQAETGQTDTEAGEEESIAQATAEVEVQTEEQPEEQSDASAATIASVPDGMTPEEAEAGDTAAAAPAIAMTGPLNPESDMQFERPYVDPSVAARAVGSEQPGYQSEAFPPGIGGGLGGGADQLGDEIIEPDFGEPEMYEPESAASSPAMQGGDVISAAASAETAGDDAVADAYEDQDDVDQATTAETDASIENGSDSVAESDESETVAVQDEDRAGETSETEAKVEDEIAEADVDAGADVETTNLETTEIETLDATPEPASVPATSTPSAVAIAPQPTPDRSGQELVNRGDDTPARLGSLTVPLLIIHLAVAMLTVTLGILWWRSRP